MSDVGSVIQGDCLEVLRQMPDQSFDALITDPPAGIAFMGKNWDSHKGGMLQWVNWLGEVLTEVHRVLKPGAVGLIWSIPRTSHWTGMAIELSGLRIIDTIAHIQGSGFPKAQDISKGIDRHFGREREVVGEVVYADGKSRKVGKNAGHIAQLKNAAGHTMKATAPNHPLAQQWDGWKSAQLKPAHEDWWLVQKKCEGTIVHNILTHGVGGLNIEAARIGLDGTENLNAKQSTFRKMGYRGGDNSGTSTYKPSGRYPANMILQCSPDCDGDNHADHCPVTLMGEQSGECKSGGQVLPKRDRKKGYDGGWNVNHRENFHPGDTGTSARYFKQLAFDYEVFKYCPKASRSDRTHGGQVDNRHPTVKPTNLLEYFAKLICPPGGIVLDPFGGSGSTAIGCLKAGMNFCLIEQDPESVATIEARIAAWESSTQTLQQVLSLGN